MSATVTPAAKRIIIPHGLTLRPHQQRVIQARYAGHRRRIANQHRQAGKGIESLTDLTLAAFESGGAYALVSPTLNMSRRNVWDAVRASDGVPYLDVIPKALILEKNEAEMSLTLATAQPGKVSRILFLGGDDPSRLRGLALKGCVLDEYAQFQGSTVLDTLRPILNASGGWLLVLSTPFGVGNHFHDLWKMAQGSPDWWTDIATVDDTGLIAPEVLARELAEGQRPEWIAQEYRCQFVVGLVASIFGDLLTKAEQEGRILDLPRREDRATVVALDLGVDDLTVATFVQTEGEWRDIVDVQEYQGLSLAEIIRRVRATGWNVVDWIAPHDIEVRDLSATGSATGAALSRWSVAAKLGVRFQVAPRLLLPEGLDAVRRLFGSLRFESRRAAKMIDALAQYQRRWDAAAKVYSEKPLHSWASHYADSLRTYATGYTPRRPKPPGWRPAPSKGILTDVWSASRSSGWKNW